MDVCLVIKERLKELGLQQKDLAPIEVTLPSLAMT